MERLLFSLSIIICGLTIGCALQLLDARQVVRLPIPLPQLRRRLQQTGLLFFLPVSFMSAVWVVDFADLRLALLPLLGVIALTAGGLFGLALARLSGAEPRRTGVLFCCSSFTNIGAIGALVCYMFLGEAGFALVALYKMFEEIVYYTIGFPVARYYSGLTGEPDRSTFGRISSTLRDPFVATILIAFFTGLTLNILGVGRPSVFTTINELFIPAGTFVLIVSIGLGMRFSRLGENLGYATAVTLLKAAAIPVVVTGLGWAIGLGAIDQGLPLKVVLILSSMPVAFNSLVAASLYDLDLDLANSCWLVSTMSLILVLPWLYWLLHLI